MINRDAVVEGRFYPANRQQIFDQIREIESAGRYALLDIRPKRILGAVLPHAGHIYSGHQTVPFFRLLQSLGIAPETFIIVHPNHSGTGAPLAIDDADIWTNSIGEVPVDREFAQAMELPFDQKAHAGEHSAEVIVPYIQYYQQLQSFSIVPVCMGDQGFHQASFIAERIVQAVNKTGRDIMVLASCDFSHFLTPGEGIKKDQLVLDVILSRNTSHVEKAVKKHQASICGYGPIMALMQYTSSLEPDYRIRILARGHSGEVIASREVVDYISMVMYV